MDRILARYPHAPALARWHMRGRLRLCPYDALPKHLTGAGSILDIGCGFGHLAWFMADRMPSLRYFGADVDVRKVRLAAACPREAEPAPSFRHGDLLEAATTAGWPARFGNIVLLDVLYLMPWELQVRVLGWALDRLADAAGSALVIKSMDAPAGFAGLRAVAEEWIMVSLLRRTMGSGTLLGARPPEAYAALGRDRGLRCTVERLPTFNPSYILTLRR
jgi:2-polyprenyl-6-hydroxyphenyl methylase/3-demethylubiquinone-9 3-methyltransferase